jgi:hypothetical protein
MNKNGEEQDIDEARTYTAAEAAVIKRVTRRSVYDAIHTGRLAARRTNWIWLILGKDLKAWQVVGHRPRTQPDDVNES